MNDDKSKPPEPSIEEILASIRRIITEDDKGKAGAAPDAGADDGILDLTERVDGPSLGAAAGESDLVSEVTAAAAAKALAQLVAALERGSGNVGDIKFASGDTLEDMVKDAVKPMAKEWLDQNLPTLVENLVRKEIQRLVGRAKDI
ncbi:MAG: DUF2497 domain-containing protein [Alphaproteobacteria bacterium]|nr:DUF2497 domain-containing protein [Alphaproteobacteria bacterium]